MVGTERFVLFTSLGLMSVFFFAILVSSKLLKEDLPECLPNAELFTEGRLVELDEKTYQLFYVSKMWSFDPEVVEIRVGSEVDIYLTSQDVVHGLYIENTNVNMMAVTGTVNMKRTRFNKPGRYRVTCHEFCGVGHQNMQAEIIVK